MRSFGRFKLSHASVAALSLLSLECAELPFAPGSVIIALIRLTKPKSGSISTLEAKPRTFLFQQSIALIKLL